MTSINKSYVLSYNMIEKDKYEYYPPHKNENGCYVCSCRYRLNKNEVIPIYVETPKLITPSGIIKIGNDFFIDLEISISTEQNSNYNSNSNFNLSNSFYEYLISNDENNINQCHQNSKEWFNNFLPLHVIEKYYKCSIMNRAGGNNPIWRVRVPSYKGKIITEIYNHQRELLDPSYINAGDEIVCIVEFIGLQFHTKLFSPEYEIQKMKIFKTNRNKQINSGYLFSNSEEDSINNNNKKSNLLEITSNNLKNTTNTTNTTNMVSNPSNIFTNIYNNHIANLINKHDLIRKPIMIAAITDLKKEKLHKEVHVNKDTSINIENKNVKNENLSLTEIINQSSSTELELRDLETDLNKLDEIISSNNDIPVITKHNENNENNNENNDNENIEYIENNEDNENNDENNLELDDIEYSDSEDDLEIDDSDLLDLELVH
jgi:DNA-binding XRE family transcriptional regulator